jgi:hypothetical protein
MKRSILNDAPDMPRGLQLSPAQEQAINLVLDQLLEKCPAQFLLLAEISGQLIAVHGDRGRTDPGALSALIAGDLAANQEIARITEQDQHSQLTLREGPMANTFLAEVGRKMVLYMRVKSDVPIGWARLVLLESCRTLVDIITAPVEELDNIDLNLDEGELDKMIGDGFDSIWTE